jgi:hypothetical protein
MLSLIGTILTGIGTVVAIIHPSVGAQWAGEYTERREWWIRRRYYTGIVIIIIGTAMQGVAAWQSLK